MSRDEVSSGGPSGGPLEGVRVVEMGSLLAGPFCGQLLGDMGAEILKIENPDGGDIMRGWGRERAGGQSLWWPIVARNKKSVTLNLRSAEGQAAAQRLMADADIVIENFRPGTLERWNLGYDEVRSMNPRVIYIRVTGFGQSGPYASRAGYGSIGEAMGGLRYVVGDPSTPPSRMGISIGDALAGTLGALGGLSALHEAQRSGQGQVIDCAIYEAVLTYMESLIPEYDLANFVRERTGAILPNVAPSNVYPTSDGDILIAANQDTVFIRLVKAMGEPELADDDRYATHLARGQNQLELDELIADWTAGWSSEELLARLEDFGVPAGKIYRAADMLEDPHFQARESIVSVPSSHFGQMRMQNIFPRLSRTPGHVRWIGPELGEHNSEILRDRLGMSNTEIEKANAH